MKKKCLHEIQQFVELIKFVNLGIIFLHLLKWYNFPPFFDCLQ